MSIGVDHHRGSQPQGLPQLQPDLAPRRPHCSPPPFASAMRMLSSHTLDRLCWLLPCSTITIFEEPLPAPADPPAKLVLLQCDTGVVSDADHGHRKHWLLTDPCQEPKTRSNTAYPRRCNPGYPLTQHPLATWPCSCKISALQRCLSTQTSQSGVHVKALADALTQAHAPAAMRARPQRERHTRAEQLQGVLQPPC